MENTFDKVFHLGASINVQDSIDSPEVTFQNDVVGTFEILERCREQFMTLNGLDFDAEQFLLEDVEKPIEQPKTKSCNDVNLYGFPTRF